MIYLVSAGRHIELLVRLQRCLVLLSDVFCWLMAASFIIRQSGQRLCTETVRSLSLHIEFRSIKYLMNGWLCTTLTSYVSQISNKCGVCSFYWSVTKRSLMIFIANATGVYVFESLSVVCQNVLAMQIHKSSMSLYFISLKLFEISLLLQ